MPLDYLPIMERHAGPNGPRRLVSPPSPAWTPVTKPLASSRVGLLSSAAIRTAAQEPFPANGRGHRAFAAAVAAPDGAPDPDAVSAGLVIDHPSPVGADARRDPEVVVPRAALASLARRGAVGGVTATCWSFRGGNRRHAEVQEELAPALAAELAAAGADLALLVPY
jgi:hypothetical protein